jgi:hypothetical protein
LGRGPVGHRPFSHPAPGATVALWSESPALSFAHAELVTEPAKQVLHSGACHIEGGWFSRALGGAPSTCLTRSLNFDVRPLPRQGEDLSSTQAQTPFEYRGLLRSAKVPSCVISRDDIQKLCGELNARSDEALEQHLATVQRSETLTKEQFDEAKQRARDEAPLAAIVQGGDGEQLVARSIAGLAVATLPDRISWVSFDSAASLQILNIKPIHRFTVHLDFTEPPGFGNYNPWDQPMPNTSKVEVIGSDQTWVTGVYESTLAFFRKRGRDGRGFTRSTPST